jgi:hypothetical protein
MGPEHEAARARLLEAAADTWVSVRVPFNGDDLNGAIVELQLHPDEGIFTGQIRIPGPPRP